MGNLCGKQSKDGFDGPGRTLGSAPPPATKASVPATENAGSSSKKRIVGGPPRTLGEGNSGSDPRSAAAAAAEARANKTSTGDLQKKLDAQKRQTHTKTLEETARENLAFRNADEQAKKREYN